MPLPVAAPIAMGAASLLASIFGQKSQNKQSQRAYDDARRQIAEYEGRYGDYQKMLQGFFGAGGQGAANLFGPQTTTTTGASSSNEFFKNNPFVTQEYGPLAGMLRKTYEGRLAKGSSLPLGYAESRARGINASYAGPKAAEANALARRGISSSATFGSPTDTARRGAILDLQAQLPLLSRDLQNQDLAAAQGLTAQFGLGQEGRRRSTTQSSQETMSPANIAAILQYFGMLAPPSPTIIGQPQQQSLLSGLPAALQTALSAYAIGQGDQGQNDASYS